VATRQQLAETHRVSQGRLAAALVSTLTRAYGATLTPTSLSFGAFESFVSSVMPLILEARRQSAARAAVFLGDNGITSQRGEEPIPEAIVTSLRVTGWSGLLDRVDKGVAVPKALELASTAMQGAAERHALAGGRSLIVTTMQARTDLGWYRIARVDCCYFCAALASRGAVYGRDSFAESDPRFLGDGDAKVHDHCHCSLGVVERDGELPEVNLAARSLWEQTSIEARSGGVPDGYARDPMNVFRRAWQARAAA